MQKAKIENWLKEHQFEYEWNNKRKYLAIIKFKCWLIPYYELENNILVDINLSEFFKNFIENNNGYVKNYEKDNCIYHYYGNF